MVLPTQAMIDTDFFREISVKEWSADLRVYIKFVNDGRLLPSKEHVFMFESFVFAIHDGELRVMTVCVSFVNLEFEF